MASKSFANFFDRFFERYLRKEGSEDPGESFEEAPRELRETLREPWQAVGKLREAVRQARGAPEGFGSGHEGPGKLWESVPETPGNSWGRPERVAGTPRRAPGCP